MQTLCIVLFWILISQERYVLDDELQKGLSRNKISVPFCLIYFTLRSQDTS